MWMGREVRWSMVRSSTSHQTQYKGKVGGGREEQRENRNTGGRTEEVDTKETENTCSKNKKDSNKEGELVSLFTASSWFHKEKSQTTIKG